jgi:periplasmic protein TonB
MKNLFFLIGLLISGISSAQKDSLALIDTTEHADDYIFSKVDKMPVFPGGEGEMIKFLQKSIEYPAVEKKAKVGGTCYATFVIEENGSITNRKI